MATNSPFSTAKFKPLRIWVPPKDLPTFLSSRKGMEGKSGRLESGFDQAHQPIEDKANDTNRNNRQDDVLVDERIIFLPKKPAHSRTAGEHLSGNNHEPRDAQA